LRQLFPEFNDATFDESITEQPLLPNAEGWFAIPKWQTLAPTYGKAVEKMFTIIASQWKFHNYRKGQLGVDYFRQHAKTVQMIGQLGDEQHNFDILVVAAQFGLRHRGRSVRRARTVFAKNEFGLGVFAVGCMLLTHPERLWGQLHVDCAGDEFDPVNDGDFCEAPFLCFDDSRVEFDAYWFGSVLENYCSVSAFVSQ